MNSCEFLKLNWKYLNNSLYIFLKIFLSWTLLQKVFKKLIKLLLLLNFALYHNFYIYSLNLTVNLSVRNNSNNFFFIFFVENTKLRLSGCFNFIEFFFVISTHFVSFQKITNKYNFYMFCLGSINITTVYLNNHLSIFL